MKKLMTTMLAVAVGVGLHAIGNADTGTSFEGLTGDAPYDIYASTGELTAQAANETYWVTNGTETLTVVAGTSLEQNNQRPSQYKNNDQLKYLSIKTTLGNPVTRNVSVGGTGTSIGSGFYFDSLVKFTAFDDDPAIDLNGGKLAVWLKENLNANDEPVSTNLVITAGFLDSNLEAKAYTTNYVCTVNGVDLNDGAWHRVTVKAIESIYKAGIAPVPGFVVFIDKTRVVCGEDKGIINKSSLTDNAYVLDSEDALFPSADQIGGNKLSIGAVQFDGQGDVDDLVFTATAPDFAKDAEFFAINLGEHVASVEGLINGEDLFNISAPTSIVWADSQNVQITGVTCDAGWMEGSVTNESGTVVSGAYTTTAGGSITVTAKPLGAYVGDTPFETLAEAVAYVNTRDAGSGTYTITMAANASGNVNITNAGITNILDLAGNTFTGTATDAPAIYVTSGALIITDSSQGKTGVVQSAVDGGALVDAVGYDAGTVAVQDGKFNGKVSATEISGGSFLATYNEQEVNAKGDLDQVIVAGYEATQSGDYFVLTEKANYVAQIGETGYETLAAAVAAAKTLGDASAPVTITLLSDVTAGGIQLTANNFSGYGLVLDLGGHTYTMNAQTEKDPIDVRTNNIFTVSNGTLAVSYAARDIARIYGGPTTVVTFKDVTISGDNLEASASDKPVGVFQIEGGFVNIIGSTSINSGSAPYAIKFGNHANQTQYVCGTVTVNTTGNIIGDVLLTGGTYDETAIGAGSVIDYYYGTNVWSTWEDANNVVFAARDGELSAVGDENDVSGNLYKEFAQAFAATNEFTLLKDYAGNVTFTMDTKIKANGHQLTGTLTAPEGYEVRAVDGVYQAARPIYTITFVAGDNASVTPASTNYTVDSGVIALPTPTLNGGAVGPIFDGWTNETYTITTGNLTYTPAAGDGNFTLYAKWTAGGPTYPTYLEGADADVKAQYTTWAQTYGADENSVYEDAFLLNVAPDTTGATIDATAISISGTKVTIDINRGNLNGVPYVKKASTVAGLATAPKTTIEIVPADQVQGLDNGGRITLENESGTAQFYQIGVQSTPLNQN